MPLALALPVPAAPPRVDGSAGMVDDWIAAALPSLMDMFVTTTADDDGVAVWQYEPAQPELDIAVRVAVEIARVRLGKHPDKFFEWVRRLRGDDELDEELLGRAQMVLNINLGTPEEPRPDSHMCGLVAETLLGHFLQGSNRGNGLPVHFEGHDWSVTDPGGDCLAIYPPDGAWNFVLWESKVIYGATSTARSVACGAANQLHERAAEYLGRFAAVASRLELGPDLHDFLLELPDLWLDDAPTKAAGIGLAADTERRAVGAFSKAPEMLSMDAARVTANFTGLGRFLDFAMQVRSLVWGEETLDG
jgi:hypothetical protein